MLYLNIFLAFVEVSLFFAVLELLFDSLVSGRSSVRKGALNNCVHVVAVGAVSGTKCQRSVLLLC